MAKTNKTEVEYRLYIFPKYDELKKKVATVFHLETMEEFSNFNYVIIVKEKVQGKTIQFDIHGLKTPKIALPAFGPATFTQEYENLHGRYNFLITKLDGEANEFELNISKKEITVEKSPRRKFVEINVTDSMR